MTQLLISVGTITFKRLSHVAVKSDLFKHLQIARLHPAHSQVSCQPCIYLRLPVILVDETVCLSVDPKFLQAQILTVLLMAAASKFFLCVISCSFKAVLDPVSQFTAIKTQTVSSLLFSALLMLFAPPLSHL